MSPLTRPWISLGSTSTSRNAYILILSRALRMFAHGCVTLIIAPFLSTLGTPDNLLGLFMTLTLLGDVFLGMYLTLIADGFGRRKVLLLGSGMMVLTGVVFVFSENYFVLLLAAIFGVVTVTGNDFGPFRSIEESIISSGLTDGEDRAGWLGWYITAGGVGSAVGSEVSGRVVHGLKKMGWGERGAFHAVFGVYAVMGLVNAGMVFGLDGRCEVRRERGRYEMVAREEDLGVDVEVDGMGGEKKGRWCGFAFSQISKPTLKVIYKLWILLAIDSIAEGLAPYALTTYYIDQKFHPDKSTLGDITSVGYFLGAISTIFAGPLARRFGLVNTMVFTHAPSSAAILLFPVPQSLSMTVVLLFIRIGLERLDQAPRGAFIATIVQPEELTAVYGIAGMLRTLSAMPGPFLTGILAHRNYFRLGFMLAGSVRLAYDISLYAVFSKVEAATKAKAEDPPE